jgi:Spy/CpxP family protein refolding chaperone
MLRTRSSAILSLILVFASGMLVGVAAYRLYVTTTASANATPRTMAEYRRRFFVEMKEKVGVRDEQIAPITKVLDEAKQRFDELHAKEKPLHDQIQQEHVEAMKALLDDKQKIAYDKWRIERERMRALAQQTGR